MWSVKTPPGDMKTLETEKFDTLKELAELQTNISLGRAELKKLEETTEEYMVVREKEAGFRRDRTSVRVGWA